nr:neuroblastoma breakpoint family member 15 [Equus asinus]
MLSNQLQKYKCGACNDIIELVLGEKLQFQEGKPTEKSTLVEKLKKYDVLIQDQAQELAQLRQTIEKGIEVSVLLKQHLRNLLTHDDPTNFQGQGFQERLAEGCRLAERLGRKLSPGKAVVCPDCTELLQEIPLTRIFFLFNLSLWFSCPIWGHHGTSTGGVGTERRNALENHAEEENKEEKASVDPSLRTELQEKESVNEALMGSVDEGPMTSSSHQYPSGSHEPPNTNVFLS